MAPRYDVTLARQLARVNPDLRHVLTHIEESMSRTVRSTQGQRAQLATTEYDLKLLLCKPTELTKAEQRDRVLLVYRERGLLYRIGKKQRDRQAKAAKRSKSARKSA